MLFMATLVEIKDELGIKDTQDNQALTRLAEGIQARFDSYCHRSFGHAVDVEEVHDGGVAAIELKHWPVETVTSVHCSDARLWTAATLVEAGDYFINKQRGLLVYATGMRRWLYGVENIRVVYTGGYTAETVPEDLKRAFRMQLAFEWRNRTTMGVTSMSANGMSAQFTPADLLPEVKQSLTTHIRF